MKRISVEEIKEAFEKTGLKPVLDFYEERDCNDALVGACALVAILASKGVSFALSDTLTSLFPDFSSDYLDGVMAGWDADSRGELDAGESDEYRDGFEVGFAAYAAITSDEFAGV